MDKGVKEFIQGKKFAVVGVSRGGKKFGNTIYTELKDRGFTVYPINPEASEIDGNPCYPNVKALKDKVDGVIVCVPKNKGDQVIRDAAAAGINQIWLQMGADSPELVKLAKSLNLNTVAGKCILMFMEPVKSFHVFHRFVARLIGQA